MLFFKILDEAALSIFYLFILNGFASNNTLSHYCAQSAIDYVGYASGQTDEWKGTGVWSGLSVKRDEGQDEGSTKNDNPTKDDKKNTPKST